MKLSFALFSVATVLSVPSLPGNAFLAGSGRNAAAPVVVLHESSSPSPDSAASSSATIATESEPEPEPEEAPLSSSWFENNDVMADSIFDSIDIDKDGTITNDELQTHLEGIGYSNISIRTLFATLDKNADGLISREEMRFAFTNYDIQALYQAFGVGTVGLTNEKTYTRAIDKIRSNANIDPKASPAMLNILADLIFDKIDTDKSGEIDADELKKHFEAVTKKTNGSTTSCKSSTTTRIERGDDDLSAESILKALDLNSDGVISREEMRSGFNQFNPKSLSKALGIRAARTSEV